MTLPALSLALALLPLSALLSRSADFPEPADSEKVPGTPLPAAEAAARVELPEGFAMNVFASEPMVRNPISMAWDGRGRMWIAENFTYAEHPVRMDPRFRDRILMLEDPDHNGSADRQTVFADHLQGLTSVETGPGGIWALALPRLIFIPDGDGDGRADGPERTLLDGFTIPMENHHNCASGLRWGPDGWLYGRCGASGPASVGAPGSPPGTRVPVNGGIWRFHPGTGAFESLCSGTTNPWGMDWDAAGEAFFTNTVNGHLWHLIPGAHYTRSHTLDPNPLTYFLIDQHADHYHFDTGRGWTASRDGKANSYGGGHAHCGLMVYQGCNWPADTRDRIYLLNFHGRRINIDLPQREGSGFSLKHGPDMALMADPFFRPVDLGSGPDGAVYVLDWSDTGECHDSTGVHRNSGRVYRISHRTAPPAGARDWRGASPAALMAHVSEADEWQVRAGRAEVMARHAAGEPMEMLRTEWIRRLSGGDSVNVRLRCLWALHVSGGVPEELLLQQLVSPGEAIRIWAVRLLTDAWLLDTPAGRIRAGAVPETVFAALLKATADSTPPVRLALASALQRLPAAQRPALATALARHRTDYADHNLPALLWYGLLPLAESLPMALASLAAAPDCPPLTRECIARCLTSQIDRHPEPADAMLAAAAGVPGAIEPVTRGMVLALKGRRRAPAPKSWPAFAAQEAGPEQAALRRELAVVFGDGRALAEIRALVLNRSAGLEERQAALASFIEAKPDDLREVCEAALKERFLNTTAVTGLTGFDDPALGITMAASYGAFHPAGRPALITALTARPAFAAALLDAIAAGSIPRDALSAFQARQISAFRDGALTKKLETVWGTVRGSSAGRRAFITSLKSSLTPQVLAAADLKAGRRLFTSLCSTCHTLYGEGGRLGPDLTGSQRHDPDYLLENIVDPGAVVTADFRMSVLRLKDGSSAAGVIASKTETTLTLREPAGERRLELPAIAAMETSTDSIMPAGLLEALPPKDIAALIAYLQHPVQVPLK